jgi:hypothetical protein
LKINKRNELLNERGEKRKKKKKKKKPVKWAAT